MPCGCGGTSSAAPATTLPGAPTIIVSTRTPSPWLLLLVGFIIGYAVRGSHR